ncbi:hypothetical protein LEMLEM_LOCUS10881, partial [Lemmus lemmus]
MTALTTPGRSSGNLLKGSTSQNGDRARYASPAFTGFQMIRKNRKSKDRRRCGDTLLG